MWLISFTWTGSRQQWQWHVVPGQINNRLSLLSWTSWLPSSMQVSWTSYNKTSHVTVHSYFMVKKRTKDPPNRPSIDCLMALMKSLPWRSQTWPRSRKYGGSLAPTPPQKVWQLGCWNLPCLANNHQQTLRFDLAIPPTVLESWSFLEIGNRNCAQWSIY